MHSGINMDKKTSFKIGFIKAMASRGITPSDFEKIASSMSKEAVVGGLAVGGGLVLNTGWNAAKGLARGSYYTVAEAPDKVGRGIANLMPTLGANDPLQKSVDQARGEALVMAYGNAASEIRSKIEKLKEQRQKQEAARVQSEQENDGGQQELYEEITSK
jgi:hypothetical protein